MATSEQRDAYRRVILLIMEDIEGCEMEPASKMRVELMNVVSELECRIIEGPNMVRMPVVAKHGTFDRKYKPKGKKAKAWQGGPLAGTARTAVEKPPWFSE